MMPQPHFVTAFGMPGGWEWLAILIIALLLFGNRLPTMMRGLGGSIKEFKKGMEDGDNKKIEDTKKPDPPEGAVGRGDKSADSTNPDKNEKK